jgi:hypothetical protein
MNKLRVKDKIICELSEGPKYNKDILAKLYPDKTDDYNLIDKPIKELVDAGYIIQEKDREYKGGSGGKPSLFTLNPEFLSIPGYELTDNDVKILKFALKESPTFLCQFVDRKMVKCFIEDFIEITTKKMMIDNINGCYVYDMLLRNNATVSGLPDNMMDLCMQHIENGVKKIKESPMRYIVAYYIDHDFFHGKIERYDEVLAQLLTM